MLRKIIDFFRNSSLGGKRNISIENREKDVYHDERVIAKYDFEFLIRRVEGYEFSDDFGISMDDCQSILTPNNLKYNEFKLLEHEFCEYIVLNSKVSVSSEFSGVHINIENNGIKRESVKSILEEIRVNIEKSSNLKAQIFEI